jgi:hypothetical protein
MTALDYLLSQFAFILIGGLYASASLNHESSPQEQVVQQICSSEFQLLAADSIPENRSGYLFSVSSRVIYFQQYSYLFS